MLRGRMSRYFKIEKAYIALFVCFATKALPLEVICDLTECFLSLIALQMKLFSEISLHT